MLCTSKMWARTDQDSWRAAGMSNFHCLYLSHPILSNTKDVRLMNSFPTMINMFLGGMSVPRTGGCLPLGDSVEVVILLSSFLNLLICVQDKSVHIGKHVRRQALRGS